MKRRVPQGNTTPVLCGGLTGCWLDRCDGVGGSPFSGFDIRWDILSQACCSAETHQLTSRLVSHQASCTWAASALPCTTTSLPRSMEVASFCDWRIQTRLALCLGQRRILRTCWNGQVRLAGKGPCSKEGRVSRKGAWMENS